MSAAKPRYEVLWTETARTDVEEIARFSTHDSVKNALAVLDRLEHAAENLAVLPERGRFVPELKQLGVLAYREIIIRPWRIIYRFDADRVYVLARLSRFALVFGVAGASAFVIICFVNAAAQQIGEK